MKDEVCPSCGAPVDGWQKPDSSIWNLLNGCSRYKPNPIKSLDSGVYYVKFVYCPTIRCNCTKLAHLYSAYCWHIPPSKFLWSVVEVEDSGGVYTIGCEENIDLDTIFGVAVESIKIPSPEELKGLTNV